MANINFYYNRYTQHNNITLQTGTSTTLTFQFFATGSTPKDLTGNAVTLYILYPDGYFTTFNGTITDAVNGIASVAVDLTSITATGRAGIRINTNDRAFEILSADLI